MASIKYNLVRRSTTTGLLGVAYVRDEIKIRYIIENAGAGNVVRIEGQLVGQASWDLLLDISGTDNEVVDVSTYEMVRVTVLTYDSLSNYIDIIGSSFDKVASSGGDVDSVNGQTGAVLLALDDLSDITAPAPALNDILTFNGVAWVNSPNGAQEDVDDLIVLSGVPANSTDLGTFTGSVIPDNSDIKEALQALETFAETDAQDLADHIANPTAAHAASAISYDDSVTGYGLFTVQETVDQLFLDEAGTNTALAAHISETVGAHAASAISVSPTGGLTTDVQSSLEGLDTGKEPTITVLPIAKGGTNNSSAYTAGSVIFSNGTSLTQDNANLFFNDASNYLKIQDKIELGSVDAFARPQIWNYLTNSVLRLGAWQADGDAVSASSEGIAVYSSSLTGTPIDADDGGYARIKHNRFGLFTIDSSLPAYTAGDYYFRVDNSSLYFRNNSGTKTFEVTRSTGQIDTALAAGYVKADASGILSSSTIPASDIVNTPSGNLSATDVQAALNELQSDIDTRALDSAVIKKDGSVAFTGDQSMGGFNLTNLADPVAAQDAATKAYVDAVAEGLKPKEAVRAGTLVNGTLATAFENGDTIDGVVLVTGDRILLKDQTAPEENGIYIVQASGAPVRAPDFDSLTPIDEINGSYTFIQEGSQAGQGWVQTGVVTTLGVDPINFVFFNSVAGIIGGDGITVTGNTIDVDHDGEGLTFVATQLALELDGATLSKSATGLKLGDTAVTPGTYGSASETVTITVDQQGRLTAASDQAILITASQVSDFTTAASAAAPVQSVNTQTGAVVLDSDDIAEGTNLYFTDERAQDAVGTILTDSNTIDFTYNDGTPSIVADVRTQMSITSDASGIKLVNDATSPGMTYYYGTDGAGVKGFFPIPVQGSAGDIQETSFSAANNQATPADVTGFAFAAGVVRGFDALLTVSIDATSDLYEIFQLVGINKNGSFDMAVSSVGDNSGIVFSITSAGQVQYTSTNVSGFVSDTMKFRAETTTV